MPNAHNGRQSFSDDAIARTRKVLAKWIRAIVPAGRGSMAVILPVDVCKAAGVQPGVSSVSVYQLDESVGVNGNTRFVDFHIRINVDPRPAEHAAASSANINAK